MNVIEQLEFDLTFCNVAVQPLCYGVLTQRKKEKKKERQIERKKERKKERKRERKKEDFKSRRSQPKRINESERVTIRHLNRKE